MEEVRSPCMSICALDEDDVCTGCFRTAGEITDWRTMDNARRAQVLVDCSRRRRESGIIIL